VHHPYKVRSSHRAVRGPAVALDTKAELFAKLEADPRFKKSTTLGAGVIIVGAKPSVAQKPQSTDVATHSEGDDRS